jgi:hypothetical protein
MAQLKAIQGIPVRGPEHAGLPQLDLRKFSRNPERTVMTIDLVDRDGKKARLITCGEPQISSRDRPFEGCWCIAARTKNATDFEHDSSYLFQFEVIGLEFGSAHYGQVTLRAWIAADDVGGFRVPDENWNPMAGAEPCEECKGKDAHQIVSYFVPPVNEKLYERIKGSQVEIVIYSREVPDL